MPAHQGEDTVYQYSGKYGIQTDQTKLFYMRARYYDPNSKRFLGQDILMGNLSDIRSLNRYAYVEGNPMKYIDPTGMFAQSSAHEHNEYGKWKKPKPSKISSSEARKILEDSYIRQSYPIIPSNPSNGITDFIRNDISEKTKRSIYDNMPLCEKEWNEKMAEMAISGLPLGGFTSFIPEKYKREVNKFLGKQIGNLTTSTAEGFNFFLDYYKENIGTQVTRLGNHPVAETFIDNNPLKIFGTITKWGLNGLAVYQYSSDIYTIWTEDNGNTTGKRTQKTVIKTISHAASFGVGAYAGKVGAGIVVAGLGSPSHVLGGALAAGTIIFVGNVAIGWAENKVYELLEIE